MKAGRSVTTQRYATLLPEAREGQRTDAFRAPDRLRGRVGRTIAELVRHGLRDTRYVGEKGRQLQPLFKLAEAGKLDLSATLGASTRVSRGAFS